MNKTQKTVRLGDFVENPDNPRKISDEAFARLVEKLKRIRGENGEAPTAWFQDITSMTEEQRRKFIVAANKSDGEWDLDALLEQYDADELAAVGLDDLIEKTTGSAAPSAADDEDIAKEATLKDFVKVHFLVSVPIAQVGDFVGLIDNLKKKGAEVDEQAN